jgi:hypothetical protein
MPSSRQESPKVLLVVTAAFGELFMASYFAMGCGFQTSFALCRRHFSLNYFALPGTVHQYRDLGDLLTIVGQESPDVVCLFSGYLFMHDQLLSCDDLERFLEELHTRGISVVTSDPFLGLASRLPQFDARNPLEQILSVPVGFLGELLFGQMFAYLSQVGRILKPIPHLYVVDPEEGGGAKRLTFFNPNIRRNGADASHAVLRPEVVDGPRYWLFVIAASECPPDANGAGADFRAILAEKLRETLEEGRQPVVVAPKECLDTLADDPKLHHCVFLYYCDYQKYMSVLIGAEYVFYWNIFSASVLARILNSGPVFFFGRGHVAEATPLMLDKGMERYYANATLTYLDHAARLKRMELAKYASLQDAQLFQPFLLNMRRWPTPEDVIQSLLAV